MTIKYTEKFNKLWHVYDLSLTQGKGKGGKFQALQAFNKFTEEEQDRIILDTQALMRHFKSVHKPDRLCFLSTWLNQKRFDQEIPSVMDKESRYEELKTCQVDKCNNSVLGSSFLVCDRHVPSQHDDKLRAAWKETGLDRNSPTLREDCRAYIISKGWGNLV